MLWIALLLACGGSDTGDTGRAEVDMGTLLFELAHAEVEHFYVDTTSSTLGFQLAYDTTGGAIGTWTTFDPLLLPEDGPRQREVSKLSGWSGVGDELVDDTDQVLSIVVTGLEDDERSMLQKAESDWGADVLRGASIEWLEVEVTEWVPSDEHPDAVHLRWALYGTP